MSVILGVSAWNAGGVHLLHVPPCRQVRPAPSHPTRGRGLAPPEEKHGGPQEHGEKVRRVAGGSLGPVDVAVSASIHRPSPLQRPRISRGCWKSHPPTWKTFETAFSFILSPTQRANFFVARSIFNAPAKFLSWILRNLARELNKNLPKNRSSKRILYSKLELVIQRLIVIFFKKNYSNTIQHIEPIAKRGSGFARAEADKSRGPRDAGTKRFRKREASRRRAREDWRMFLRKRIGEC